MKWTSISEDRLLAKSFFFGFVGVLLCLIHIALLFFNIEVGFRIGLVDGAGLAMQLLALSLSVLVIRRRKISQETQDKAKLMTVILAVGLLFFILF